MSTAAAWISGVYLVSEQQATGTLPANGEQDEHEPVIEPGALNCADDSAPLEPPLQVQDFPADEEHEHVPEKDSWISMATCLPTDLMQPDQYPVTAACRGCHFPIYGHSFASPWLLREPYELLYGPLGGNRGS